MIQQKSGLSTTIANIPQATPKMSNEHACIKVAVETMHRITKDNQDRLLSGNIEQLDQGIFYPCEYAEALNANPRGKPRLDWLKDKAHIYNGYIQKGFRQIIDLERTGLGGNKSNEFIIKDGITPSKALDDLDSGFSLLCCGEVCQLCYYHGIRTLLGIDKFNALFERNSATPLTLGLHSGFSNFLGDCFLVREMEGDQPVPVTYKKNKCQLKAKLGQMIFVSGPKGYLNKHPYEVDASINALCVEEESDDDGGPKFLGLGFNKPLNHAEICEHLLKGYNDNPLDVNILLSKSDIERVNRSPKEFQEKMTLDEFYRAGGGRVFINTLDMERLKQLAVASVQKGKQLLVEWSNQ